MTAPLISPLPGRFRLSAGKRIYAIGDVHGRDDLLDSLLDRISTHIDAFACTSPIIVFLGDYVDRGPSSCAVLTRLVALSKNSNVHFLKGNHEAIFIEFLRNPATLRTWKQFGGLETLNSYGAPLRSDNAAEHLRLGEQFRASIPQDHLEFLASLDTCLLIEDFYFVHAGVNPSLPLAEQSERDQLWIRDEFLKHEAPFEKFIIHGHTPVKVPELKPNRLNIDTGAYITGRLTCACIEGNSVSFL